GVKPTRYPSGCARRPAAPWERGHPGRFVRPGRPPRDRLPRSQDMAGGQIVAKLMVRGGRLVDPRNGQDGISDLIFEDGRVAEVGPELAAPKGAQVIDATGRLVLPGLVDSHTHVGGHDWPGHAMMARVGVTTALNLSGEVGNVLDGIK